MFIGMIVGAGFATGRELALYFFDESVLTLLLTGLGMGGVFALFLVIGRSGAYQYFKNNLVGKAMSCVMQICVIMGFVVMIAAADDLIYEVIGVKYIGVTTGIFVGLIAPLGMRRIKNISLLLVPLLVILTLGITIGGGAPLTRHISLIEPLEYVGMNMLMGGYLVMEEGEKVSNRDILISSTAVGVLFFVLLMSMMPSIALYHEAPMPVYRIALSKGVPYLGALLIYIAIFTTVMGYAKLIYDNMHTLVSSRIVDVSFVILLAIISTLVDFASAVNVIYTIEGYIGIFFIVYVVLSYAYSMCDREHRHDRE